MKKLFVLIMAMAVHFFGTAQLDVNITTNKIPLYSEDGDTISVCRDTLIIFEAEVSLSENPVEDAFYRWSFDDGNVEEGDNLDSLSHLYSEGGGYRIKLEVTDPAVNTGYDIQAVQVAHQAVFTGSNNGLPEEYTGICKGSFSTLTGIGYPFLWEDNVNDTLENVIPLYFDDESDYSVSFLFDEFATDALYSAGGIDSVGIELEHSDMGQVSVSMSCPNGTTVLLKDFSASNHADLGVPVEDPDPESGTGWLYYWSASSVNGIMNDAVDNPIPEADYSPEDSFDTFVGCPLNGEWTITLTDNTPDDDGFVFSQEIIFSESIEPPLWTYADTLLSYTGVWTGAGNPVTQIQTLENGGVKGIALATPETYGNNPYNYIVFTNWGCKTDTIVGLPVEKPVMTVEPESGQAELDVSLASDTPWAEINSWELGDDTPDLAGQEVTHTYMEKGTYEIVLTATDNKDCTDTDTATIEVSVEPSQLTVPNFFSPDDNGINDILTLDIEGMEDFNFSVYSRWGQNVFSTSDEDEAKAGWDGRMSLTNLKASPGVYFFVFKGTGKDGKEWEEKGSIHLAR